MKIRLNKKNNTETQLDSSLSATRKITESFNSKIEYNKIEKSKQSKTTFDFTLFLATIILFISYSVICLINVNFPLEFSKFILPDMFISSAFWIIAFGIALGFAFISFSIIYKQGASTKLKFAFIINSLLFLSQVIFISIFQLIWVCLFLSAINIFFCLLILHELKKTSKKAYAFFFVNLIICTYACLTYYVISMLN